jgi:hypothetical protein
MEHLVFAWSGPVKVGMDTDDRECTTGEECTKRDITFSTVFAKTIDDASMIKGFDARKAK